MIIVEASQPRPRGRSESNQTEPRDAPESGTSKSPTRTAPRERRLATGGALRNRVVVVTGASSGVGRAISREFAAAGARLALVARGRDGLEAAAAEVRALGGEALPLVLDVAVASDVEAAADQIVGEWGAIDIWVNNAMVSVLSRAVEISAAEFRRVIEVNYLGYVHGTLAALRHMRPRDRGVIVQIGSALTYRSIPLQSAYCASKAAIRGFTDSLRSELARERSEIALTMVHLPGVNTPQFEVVRTRMPGHPQPVPPIYQPEVVARSVLQAVLHPRREMWIGWSTARAIIGQRLMPGFLDRWLATHAWDQQEAIRLPQGHPVVHNEDNLDAPLPGDRGAHGPFDASARGFSTERLVRRHGGWLAAASAFAGLLLWRRVRRTRRLPRGVISDAGPGDHLAIGEPDLPRMAEHEPAPRGIPSTPSHQLQSLMTPRVVRGPQERAARRFQSRGHHANAAMDPQGRTQVQAHREERA